MKVGQPFKAGYALGTYLNTDKRDKVFVLRQLPHCVIEWRKDKDAPWPIFDLHLTGTRTQQINPSPGAWGDKTLPSDAVGSAAPPGQSASTRTKSTARAIFCRPCNSNGKKGKRLSGNHSTRTCFSSVHPLRQAQDRLCPSTVCSFSSSFDGFRNRSFAGMLRAVVFLLSSRKIVAGFQHL